MAGRAPQAASRMLCAAFIFYVCIIDRALLSFFGKAS
jgi:hypothetical protein